MREFQHLSIYSDTILTFWSHIAKRNGVLLRILVKPSHLINTASSRRSQDITEGLKFPNRPPISKNSSSKSGYSTVFLTEQFFFSVGWEQIKGFGSRDSRHLSPTTRRQPDDRSATYRVAPERISGISLGFVSPAFSTLVDSNSIANPVAANLQDLRGRNFGLN